MTTVKLVSRRTIAVEMFANLLKLAARAMMTCFPFIKDA